MRHISGLKLTRNSAVTLKINLEALSISPFEIYNLERNRRSI